MNSVDIVPFQKHVYEIYQQHVRSFPWRDTTNPYHIVVSEIMLQQTQVNRVQGFYLNFIALFPDFQTLAQASLHEVLSAWSGLGYNRRAVALHNIAKLVTQNYQGRLPRSAQDLVTLPGIGPNTAGSIGAFAFNDPTVFIETNIRTVFLHTFFRDQANISDKELMPLIAQTVDHNNPRAWYYALMDYGTLLKKTLPNPNRKSQHYTVQSKFVGSDRRVRGAIIRHLTQHHQASYNTLLNHFTLSDSPIATQQQLDKVVKQLIEEKMIIQLANNFLIYAE